MDVGNRQGRRSEINVTPLIDVVLVLLIIFMVLTPSLLKNLPTTVPRKADDATPPPPGDTDEIYALSNYDPFSEAFVIARGIVGDRGGRPKIASPIFKQNFDLRTGVCLDDETVALPTYAARVRAGRIEVGFPRSR